MIRRIRTLPPAAVVLLGLFTLALAQGETAKKPISYDVYDEWRSIQDTRISRDGTWLVYSLVPQDGDGELVALNLATNEERRHPRGKDGVITADGRFVVFSIAPPKAEVDKAKKAKKKPEDQPKPGIGVMSLASGEVFTAERVKSFKVPEDGGRFIAYLLEPAQKKPDAKAEEKAEEKAEQKAEPKAEEKPEDKKKEKKKDPGTDLVVRELAAGKQVTIAEVVEYAWSKNGAWLAYGTSSKTPAEDGAFAWSAADGTRRTLLSGQGHYKGFAFDEAGSRAAFVSDRDEYASEISPYRLYLWSAGSDKATEAVSGATPGVAAGMAVSEHGKLEFSRDGARLFFGTARVPDPQPKDAPDPIKVDIWHYKDPELQSMQRARAEQEKKRSYRAVFHIREKRLAQLADEDMPNVSLSEKADRALGSSNLPYRQLISWDTGYEDYYVVNVQDGSRKRILEKAMFNASISPGGGWALHFDDELRAWQAIRASDGKAFDLTGALDVSFQDETWDTPAVPRPYGSAGWTEGDKAVLLYDRYDIWEIRPDGSGARMITRGAGRKNEIVFRYQDLDPEEKAIPADRPLLLRATDDVTKATGYYRVALGRNDDPERLVMLDKAFGNFIKAKDADRVVFTLSRFEEFPDLWVSGMGFGDMRKVSDANPQQADYLWGRSELISYRNADGRPLRAILTRPENFDPAKKYPMMVYIYEERTGSLHRHVAPSPGTSINMARYVSNGYVILQPDIVYDVGYPGESALKCVVPAVHKVLEMGFVDPERIGIQGHSWGGYQISHLVTRTDLFRAAQGGASVVNMISAYGGIRWGSGMSRAFQYERTQSRIGAPPWERPLQFIENSPIFWVEKVQTPYLTIHNDEDDAVPWYQGIEFFTALRRLGKEAYMFVYNGEKHGLRQRENQKHWTLHQDEFFDHHLKGAPMPRWMKEGVSFLERGKRDYEAAFEKKESTEN